MMKRKSGRSSVCPGQSVRRRNLDEFMRGPLAAQLIGERESKLGWAAAAPEWVRVRTLIIIGTLTMFGEVEPFALSLFADAQANAVFESEEQDS